MPSPIGENCVDIGASEVVLTQDVVNNKERDGLLLKDPSRVADRALRALALNSLPAGEPDLKTCLSLSAVGLKLTAVLPATSHVCWVARADPSDLAVASPFSCLGVAQTSETAELLREKYAKKLILSEGKALQVRMSRGR